MVLAVITFMLALGLGLTDHSQLCRANRDLFLQLIEDIRLFYQRYFRWQRLGSSFALQNSTLRQHIESLVNLFSLYLDWYISLVYFVHALYIVSSYATTYGQSRTTLPQKWKAISFLFICLFTKLVLQPSF